MPESGKRKRGGGGRLAQHCALEAATATARPRTVLAGAIPLGDVDHGRLACVMSCAGRAPACQDLCLAAFRLQASLSIGGHAEVYSVDLLSSARRSENFRCRLEVLDEPSAPETRAGAEARGIAGITVSHRDLLRPVDLSASEPRTRLLSRRLRTDRPR